MGASIFIRGHFSNTIQNIAVGFLIASFFFFPLVSFAQEGEAAPPPQETSEPTQVPESQPVDWGTDIYQNINDPDVPWYGVLTPRGADAAVRYNVNAYTTAATAIAVVATEARLSPAVARGVITEGGAKVLAATAGGLANTANAYFVGGSRDTTILTANFITGFIGARVGQALPNPPGAPPTTFATSLAGSRAMTEHVRAQLDQVVQSFKNLLNPPKQKSSKEKKQ